VEFFPVAVAGPPRGGSIWFFVRIDTDEGISGWGEMAFLGAYSRLSRALVGEVEAISQEYLVGRDPLARERIWADLYQRLSMHHPDYTRVSIISGFDIALWDIAGKFYDAPIYDLLGGMYRDKIRSYSYIYDVVPAASRKHYERWSRLWLDPEAVADCAQAMVEEGFDALKLDPVPPRGMLGGNDPGHLSLEVLSRAATTVGTIRERVGDRCDILIGTHGQMTTSAAIRLAERLEPFDPLWFEEPVPPDNAEEMARVAGSTTIPVATGERLVTVFEFQRLAEARAAAIFQPDLGSCGGITVAKKVAAIAESHYLEMAPHVWAGPIVTAASLQLDAAIVNFLIQESIYRSGGFFDELLTTPFHWEGGFISVPTGPGLGTGLREEALRNNRA
jgi:2-dehydro-3-deoxyphosphogalactonate aldolase